MALFCTVNGTVDKSVHKTAEAPSSIIDNLRPEVDRSIIFGALLVISPLGLPLTPSFDLMGSSAEDGKGITGGLAGAGRGAESRVGSGCETSSEGLFAHDLSSDIHMVGINQVTPQRWCHAALKMSHH
eukprot:7892778-Ditylum_brightwellii.AAC.1